MILTSNIDKLDAVKIDSEFVHYVHSDISGMAKVKIEKNSNFITQLISNKITDKIWIKLTQR